MDTGKILGGMLANRARRASGNGQVLGTILDGVAKITAAANAHPRFPPQHHAPFEEMIRGSVRRHHQHGGTYAGPPGNWIQQQPRSTPVPQPRHDHQHHSGLDHNRRAELLVLAMIMAAQADGQLDELEQNNIVSQLQPLNRAEEDFLRRNFRRRHDIEDFVSEVPSGMEYEVYSVSLAAINLDTQAEAHYLRTLAECLRMSPQEVNVIHNRYGAPRLY